MVATTDSETAEQAASVEQEGAELVDCDQEQDIDFTVGENGQALAVAEGDQTYVDASVSGGVLRSSATSISTSTGCKPTAQEVAAEVLPS